MVVVQIFFVTIHDRVSHVHFKTFSFTKNFTTFFMEGVYLLLFNTRSPGIPSAHLVSLRRKNGWVDLGANQLFSTQDAWIGYPALLGHCLFRLNHLLFIYEQTLFNFSNIQLEHNFLHNHFFIHPAMWDVIPLFEHLSKTRVN